MIQWENRTQTSITNMAHLMIKTACVCLFCLFHYCNTTVHTKSSKFMHSTLSITSLMYLTTVGSIHLCTTFRAIHKHTQVRRNSCKLSMKRNWTIRESFWSNTYITGLVSEDTTRNSFCSCQSIEVGFEKSKWTEKQWKSWQIQRSCSLAARLWENRFVCIGSQRGEVRHELIGFRLESIKTLW